AAGLVLAPVVAGGATAGVDAWAGAAVAGVVAVWAWRRRRARRGGTQRPARGPGGATTHERGP
ncbi:MAG TPA: hypothetical protein VNA89_06205, partial [Gemmatimonadaceae bacterium]|nr:hypothetical protein [Gemmatimonadaceae bacterium]